MPLDYVNINGDPVTGYCAAAKPAIKAKKEAPDEYHRGWSVEGYAPGRIQAEREKAEKALVAWNEQPEEVRSKRLRDGERQPPEWVLEKWLQTHKPSKVRARPFEVESLAVEMKALAERSGWEHVRVVELAKRKAA